MNGVLNVHNVVNFIRDYHYLDGRIHISCFTLESLYDAPERDIFYHCTSCHEDADQGYEDLTAIVWGIFPEMEVCCSMKRFLDHLNIEPESITTFPALLEDLYQRAPESRVYSGSRS